MKFINDKHALCVKDAGNIVGVLLFSKKQNMICCLAVDPDYRKKGIASMLLTKALHPYALVENVVTHADYRKKGYATDCLNYAKYIAEENDCYKMMLLTGSKDENTLDFYRNAGYNNTDKTAFIQWI